MARFQSPEAYYPAPSTLELLPFRFERTAANGFLVSNMAGDFVRLSAQELDRLVELRLAPGDGLYERAYAAHLITSAGQHAQRQVLALRLRSRMAFLRELTPLQLLTVRGVMASFSGAL